MMYQYVACFYGYMAGRPDSHCGGAERHVTQLIPERQMDGIGIFIIEHWHNICRSVFPH